MSKYVIELCEEQAMALVSALDLYTRVGIGQLEEIAYLVRSGVVSIDSSRKGGAEKLTQDERDSFEALMNSAKNILGHPTNGSFGIFHPKNHVTVSRAYEMLKVVEKALAEKRDPNPEFRGVNYDGLSSRCTYDPVPVARAVDD